MVPMPTDVLLVGQPDLPQDGAPSTTGTPLSSTKTPYFNLFERNGLGMISQPPFNYVTREEHLQPGAHLIWTLPYTLRRGQQVQDETTGAPATDFPIVPNRWLVTRFEYASIADGSAPKVVAQIVKSDVLSQAEFPPDPATSQYPVASGNYPVSNLGASVPLDQWDGALPDAGSSIDLKAVGPGDVSWSVTYDNVRNIFGFHDADLNALATANNPYYYTYLIIGWYDEPEEDLLYGIDTSGNDNWQAVLQSLYSWTVGEQPSDLTQALAAWTAWQQVHGLDGAWNPDQINLPPQAKAAIVAWHDWQQANGEATAQPALARQLLCHSLISGVVWQGDQVAYGSGNPLPPRQFPSLAIGNTATEAISTYMANVIVNDPGHQQPVENIPIIARALEAFQKDLLYDYGKDPIKVENQLQATHFARNQAGKEWIVVRAESTNQNPSTDAGKQSIPLNDSQTQALTALNTLQRQQNALNRTIATQRNELFMLNYKQYIINLRKNGPNAVPANIVTLVTQSTTALMAALSQNLTTASQNDSSLTTQSQALQKALGSGYLLKEADLPAFAAPNDPVIMVAGSQLDTKLSASVVNMDFNLLDVRYTGQFITSLAIDYGPGGKGDSSDDIITPTDLLAQVTFPSWNAVPKEVMDLWVESLFLDTSAAALLATIYFSKNSVQPGRYQAIPAGADQSPLQALTAQIQKNQTVIWNNVDDLEYPPEAVLEAAGFTGVAPAHAGIAFRTQQPWTPVFMDWTVRWLPTSLNSTDPFDQWSLGELDYEWSGTSIPDTNAVELSGRSILNPSIAQNIQLKLASFQDDPNYDNLPNWLRDDLTYAAGQIAQLDILTQTVTGFTQALNTQLTAGSLAPTQSGDAETQSLLGNVNDSYVPDLGTTECPSPNTLGQQYAPIRSGHFQLLNLWVVDAFGQIMFGTKIPDNVSQLPPIDSIMWAESLTTPGDAFTKTFGQLAPRVAQSAKAELDLLQYNDDSILSNSSDATSPICGWVMANHLDNSLMVFDQAGNNLGAVIKVQSENTADNWSIRWDATPGLNTALGAPPSIENPHLAGFINGLLKTGYQGADAYDDLMAAIDGVLWSQSGYGQQGGSNLSLLVGRPLAVVRAQVSMQLAGNPIYQQGWCETGYYYNQNGSYQPTAPPYLSVPFSLRLGDAYLVENGVLGYCAADDYNTFYPVYGANGQTKTIIEIIQAGQSLDFIPTGDSGGYTSNYVQSGHTIALANDGQPVKLTVIVDPVGNIPVFPGSLPYGSTRLPNGPVTEALNNLQATFRVGPLLLDPRMIRMPQPAEVRGKWAWMGRQNITTWSAEVPVDPYTPKATLGTQPLRLMEGWLNLSDFVTNDQ